MSKVSRQKQLPAFDPDGELFQLTVGGVLEFNGRLYQIEQVNFASGEQLRLELMNSLFYYGVIKHDRPNGKKHIEDVAWCLNCGANSIDHEGLAYVQDIDSFGGTTEHVEKCTQCGISYTEADLSAVI